MRWVVIVATFGMVYLFSFMLIEMHWVRNAPPIFAFGLLGLLFGWICSFTAWRTIWCLLYNFLLAVALAVEQVGSVLPKEKNPSFETWLEASNWQIFLFIARFEQWVQDLITRQVARDDGFWAFLFILLIWLSSAWLVLCLQRKMSGWIAIFPLIGLMTYFTQNAALKSMLLISGLFMGIVIIVSQYFHLIERDWVLHKLDYPEQLWLNWGMVVILISTVVLGVAAIAPAVATPEGWREIQEWVDALKQPKTSVTSENTSPGIYAPENLALEPESNAIPLADLEKVGEWLPQEEGIVIWVRVGDTTLRPWRITVFDTYTGSGWLETKPGGEAPIDLPETIPIGRKALHQKFTLTGSGEGKLFAAAEPHQVLSSDIQLSAIPGGGSYLVLGDLQEYELISWVPNLTIAMLDSAGGEIDPLIAETYLQIPSNLPERVRKLADRLVNDSLSYYQKVIVIQNYVRNSVPYDLHTPPPSKGQDVVDYFLFEATSGFCSYYASAMTVLLRLEGIPARVATGYAPGIYVQEQGSFLIAGDSAHAWVEVYFPEYGWIAFEPTPSQEIPAYAQMDEKTFESAPKILTPRVIARRLAWLRIFGMLVGVLILGWIGRRFWQFKSTLHRENKKDLHPAERTYRRLRTQLASTGIVSTNTTTPREFLMQSEAHIQGHTRVVKALQKSTDLYEKVVFRAQDPGTTELKVLNNVMRESKIERMKIQLRFWLLKNLRVKLKNKSW